MHTLFIFVAATLLASAAHAGDCSDAQFAGASCYPAEKVALDVPATKNLQAAFDAGDLGAAETNDLESVATNAADGEVFIGTGAGTGVYVSGLAACAADEKIEYTASSPDTLSCEAIGGLVDADIADDITCGTCSSATALAANGANCSAGSYPLGVDAAGVVESCTDASTEIDSIVATHTAISDAHHAEKVVAWTDIESASLTADAGITIGTNLADATGFTTTYDLSTVDVDEKWTYFDIAGIIPESKILTSERGASIADDHWYSRHGSGVDAGDAADDNWTWIFQDLDGKTYWNAGCLETNDCWQTWGVNSGGTSQTAMMMIWTTAAGASTVRLGDVNGANYLEVDEIGLLTSSGLGSVTADRINAGTSISLTGTGELGIDTTDNQLVIWGTGTIIYPLRQYECVNLSVSDTTDEFVWVFDDAVTITKAWCRTAGNVTTETEFELSTSVGGANMTMVSDVICQELTDVITKEAVTSGGGIAAMGGLVLEVTNTPNPNPQNIVACFEYLTTQE
jgi:hypothetical protein